MPFILLVFLSSASYATAICDVSDFDAGSISSEFLSNEIILLGELHGNNETPQVASEILCEAASRGESVVLALEAPSNTSVDVIIKGMSENMPEKLYEASRKYWLKIDGRADGRTSQSVAGMIRFLKALTTKSDFNIDIVPVDIPSGSHDMVHMRDAYMAENISKLSKRENIDKVFFYGGHLHTRIPSDDAANQQGHSISDYLDGHTHTSVLLYPRSGSSWACMRPAGKMECPCLYLTAPGDHIFRTGQMPLVKFGDATKTGYNYIIELESVSASPPISDFYL